MSKHLKLRLLLLTLALVSVATAQQTWQGLKFDSNVEEARTYLAERKFTLLGQQVQMNKDRVFRLSPTYQLDASGIISKYPFDVELHFNENELKQVLLGLNTEVLRKQSPTQVANPDILAMTAGAEIRRLLIGKYGVATDEQIACSKADNPAVILGHTSVRPECKAVWRGDGQTIELEWAYMLPSQRYWMYITYKSASGL